MDQASSTNKYPSSTSEVAKMLGIEASGEDLPLGTFIPPHDASLDDSVSHDGTHGGASVLHNSGSKDSAHGSAVNQVSGPLASASQSAYLKVAKASLPYAAVFLVALFLYYFFFTNVNFSGILPSAPKAVAPQATAIEQLESQDAVAYQAWINGFYYDVTNPQITAPDTDNSGNGLSNFEKYLLNLNPKSYDTLGLGMADSQALSEGINPLTGAPLNAAQQSIINKYIDMEAVMNRLTLNKMENTGQVAGASINSAAALGFVQAPVLQYPSQTQAAAANGDSPINSSIATDQSVNVNTSIPGELSIPDLKINVPIIWSTSTNDFEQDLQNGVIHYPGTAMPGQIGTTYIAGHSSNYVWAKGSYNHIFTPLNNLANNASFSITVTQTNGQKAVFHYVVVSRQQYLPTDPAQIANTGKSLVALSTCWPINTTSKRLVLYGQLTQVEK